MGCGSLNGGIYCMENDMRKRHAADVEWAKVLPTIIPTTRYCSYLCACVCLEHIENAFQCVRTLVSTRYGLLQYRITTIDVIVYAAMIKPFCTAEHSCNWSHRTTFGAQHGPKHFRLQLHTLYHTHKKVFYCHIFPSHSPKRIAAICMWSWANAR